MPELKQLGYQDEDAVLEYLMRNEGKDFCAQG